jgi:hypothetical protein
VIFIVGAIVFAITVYGAIMAGGLALTRRELEGDEELRRRVDPGHELVDLVDVDELARSRSRQVPRPDRADETQPQRASWVGRGVPATTEPPEEAEVDVEAHRMSALVELDEQVLPVRPHLLHLGTVDGRRPGREAALW